MKKRILAIIVAMVLLLGMSATALAGGTTTVNDIGDGKKPLTLEESLRLMTASETQHQMCIWVFIWTKQPPEIIKA